MSCSTWKQSFGTGRNRALRASLSSLARLVTSNILNWLCFWRLHRDKYKVFLPWDQTECFLKVRVSSRLSVCLSHNVNSSSGNKRRRWNDPFLAALLFTLQNKLILQFLLCVCVCVCECARLRSPSNVELTETHPAEGIPGKHKRRDLFDAADLPPHLNLLPIRRDAEDRSRVPSVIPLIVWESDHLNSTHLIYYPGSRFQITGNSTY